MLRILHFPTPWEEMLASLVLCLVCRLHQSALSQIPREFENLIMEHFRPRLENPRPESLRTFLLDPVTSSPASRMLAICLLTFRGGRGDRFLPAFTLIDATEFFLYRQ